MFKYTIILALCLVSIQANSDLERMMEEMRRSFSVQNTQPMQRSMQGMRSGQQQQSNGYGQYSAPAPTPAPQMRRVEVPVKQSYSAPAPQMQRVEVPAQQSYSAPAPQMQRVEVPAQQSYSAPAPQMQRVEVQQSYGSQEVPVQSSYGGMSSSLSNPCDSMPCKNMGVCTSTGSSFTCQCTVYFNGPTCEEAAANFGRGFEHMVNGRMQPKLQTACSLNPCLNEGICSEQGNGFSCQCPWGYSGERCENFATDCSSNPCPSNKICKAQYGGGFECVCPADRVGPNCEQLNNACAQNPCHNGGVCEPIEGGDFTCDCPRSSDYMSGYTGKRCDEIWRNPCTQEVIESTEMKQFPNPWDSRSYLVCTDLNTFRTMKCAPGSRFNKEWMHCVPDSYNPPVCPSGHCLNDGQCIVDQNNELKCVCQKGYQGDFCETEIDECKTGGDQACQGGQCIDQVGGYFCQCSNGIGETCRETIPLPCTPSNLARGLFYHALPSIKGDSYVQCLDEQTWTVRRCQDGLFWNEELQTCSMEKANRLTGACASRPCQNDGHCVETSNGVQCLCKKGYEGAQCETMIDYCASNPCQNGGKCLGYAGGYSCICPDKMVDDCCCSGIINPCPPKNQIIPGVNNYAPHLVPNKYIHCDFNGHAFVRTCSQGSIWKQDMMSCLSLETVKGIEEQRKYEIQAEAEDRLNMVGKFAPKDINMGQSSSYGQQQLPPQQPQQQSYGQYSAPAQPIAPPKMTPPPKQQSYEQYSAPAPPKMTPPPKQQSYEQYSAPAPPKMTPPPKMSPPKTTYDSYAPQMLSYRSYYNPY